MQHFRGLAGRVTSRWAGGCCAAPRRRWFSGLPEHTVITMPALSPTMSQGNIAKWLINEGDEFEVGQAICDIETDKATVSFDVQEDGFLAKILAVDGSEDIPVGTAIAVTVEEKGDVAAFANFSPDGAAPASSTPAPEPEPTPAPAPTPEPAGRQPSIQFRHGVRESPEPTPATAGAGGDRVFASPLARKVASEMGRDLSLIKGSGPGGRIIEQDVLAAPAVQATPAAAAATPSKPVVVPTVVAPPRGEFVDKPLSMMRKTIANRLLESKQTIPHYQVTMECELDTLLSVRKQLNETQKDVKISVNDFVVKAAAMALREIPECNSAFMDSFVREFGNVDISVAVATPAGLITPIIKDADCKGLKGISLEMKDLAGRAKENKLQLSEFQGGSFTISNLGMFGVHQFNAIINPPQSCILAVGAGSEVLKPCSTNGSRKATVMYATLSSDHRSVDGALSAMWLQAFKRYVENPAMMLM